MHGQSAWLVINPIMVNNFAAFFNCTRMDLASLNDGPSSNTFSCLGPELFRLLLGPAGLTE